MDLYCNENYYLLLLYLYSLFTRNGIYFGHLTLRTIFSLYMIALLQI